MSFVLYVAPCWVYVCIGATGMELALCIVHCALKDAPVGIANMLPSLPRSLAEIIVPQREMNEMDQISMCDH